MAIFINTQKEREVIPRDVARILPYRLTDEIRGLSISARIEEIRLRCDKCASITVRNKNIMLSTILLRDEMDSFLSAICNHSLYAHRETINSGYVTLDGGIRVGICGRATIDNGKLLGIYDVSSMNIRIPAAIRHIGEPICRILRSQRGGGVLVYAPPGEGKTTLIAAVAAKMAGGVTPLRVAVVDTRGEMSALLYDKSLCIDILSGYPRGLGIEIATRTMNAELVVCDEIGDDLEARTMISAQNSGVTFLATAHAKDIRGLLKRTPIRLLHDACVFSSYVGISRGEMDMSYTVNSWEEADGALYGDRSPLVGV